MQPSRINSDFEAGHSGSKRVFQSRITSRMSYPSESLVNQMRMAEFWCPTKVSGTLKPVPEQVI